MESHDIVAVFVPITLFLVVGASFILAFYLQFLARKSAQETLRAAIAAGQQLDEKTIKALAERSSRTPEQDLRMGLQGFFAGVGFLIASAFVLYNGFDEDFSSILGVIGLIIGFLGIGNVVSWKIRSKLPKSET